MISTSGPLRRSRERGFTLLELLVVIAILGMLGVQYSRLPGEAWPLGGGFAVARLPVAVDGLFGFLKTADDKDKAQSNLPIAIGVAIRKGAPKPDISTPEALKRTLLAAKSIAYSEP